MAAAGPSASAVRGTCRLTAASVPRFPWEIDILLSKTNTKNNAAKPTALVWTFWLSMAGGVGGNRLRKLIFIKSGNFTYEMVDIYGGFRKYGQGCPLRCL